jgi:hypothetical protein
MWMCADTIEIQVFRNTDTDDWWIIGYKARDTVELKRIDLIYQIEQIYEDIVFFEQKS